jgi:hypothetical protein
VGKKLNKKKKNEQKSSQKIVTIAKHLNECVP